jgi:hypothetical protein
MKNIEQKINTYLNEVSDENNPNLIFQTIGTEIILKIALKKIDIIQISKNELISRGIDKKGKWVGPEKAKKVWNK